MENINHVTATQATTQLARVVRFYETGGPEVLQIETLETAAPAAHEVRISVKAIGLNRAEAMWRSGDYIETPILPARLGYDASGIVEAVGSAITHLKVGDEVSTIPSFSQNEYGVYGELILMPGHAVIKNPPLLSFEQAASVWNPFVTAYSALIDAGNLSAGQTILIPAASSSVGIAAIQVANMVGAIPVALTRTKIKRESLLAEGARYVIATDEEDIVAEVMSITGHKGADMIFDPVGGPLFTKLLASLTRGGQIFLYGALSTKLTALPLIEVLNKVPVIRGHTVWDTTKDPVRVEKATQFIFGGIADGYLKPVIAKVFPFEQIIEAHRFLESNEQIGKIVVTI